MARLIDAPCIGITKCTNISLGSAQSDLSGGFSSSKNKPLLQSKYIWNSISQHFYSIVSGGQNSLSGDKRQLSGGWGRPPQISVGRTLHIPHVIVHLMHVHSFDWGSIKRTHWLAGDSIIWYCYSYYMYMQTHVHSKYRSAMVYMYITAWCMPTMSKSHLWGVVSPLAPFLSYLSVVVWAARPSSDKTWLAEDQLDAGEPGHNA